MNFKTQTFAGKKLNLNPIDYQRGPRRPPPRLKYLLFIFTPQQASWDSLTFPHFGRETCKKYFQGRKMVRNFKKYKFGFSKNQRGRLIPRPSCPLIGRLSQPRVPSYARILLTPGWTLSFSLIYVRASAGIHWIICFAMKTKFIISSSKEIFTKIESYFE